MIIRLNPLDSFFFRDAKPFSMGEDTWANGIFPPAPSVIFGALRTIFIANKGALHLSKKELDTLTNGLEIKGICMEFKQGENWRTYFPVPKDVVKIKADKPNDKEKNCVLELFSNKQISNLNLDFFSSKVFYDEAGKIKNTKIEDLPFDALCRSSDFEAYLDGDEEIGYIKNYLSSEPKIGIGRDNLTRSSEESNLYRVEMMRMGDFQFSNNSQFRPENIRFVVDFEFKDWNILSDKIFKMGGEGKFFHSSIENGTLEDLEFPELLGANGKTYFKVCLLTPAFFLNGILPSWIDDRNNFKGNYKGINLKMLSVVSGKALHLGGFDMKEKRPKYMRKAVSTGAVYYFEAEGTGEAINKKIKDIFHHQSISELDKEQGFGIAVVGTPKINF